MSIHMTSFDSAFEVICQRPVIFVVPTFQRPYAWEDSQITDLMEDLSVMDSRDPPMHYLAPIHVAKIGKKESNIFWDRYTDPNNEALKALSANQFQDDSNKPFNVYFVIDGQQRLTTLFAFYSRFTQNITQDLTAKIGGQQIPRLILNPVADHQFFKSLFFDIKTAPQGQSQKRIDHLFKRASEITSFQKEALRDENLKLLLVEVDANYGLKSFLGLNDRGKQLSILDKLKCFWMEKDEHAKHMINIHNAFGNAFRLLDHTAWGEKPFSEDCFVRLLGIRAFWHREIDCEWYDSNRWFEDYFKPTLNEANTEYSIEQRIGYHHMELESIIESLYNLTSFLDGSNQVSDNPSNIIKKRKIRDDYRAFFLGWDPDDRSLSFLLRLKNSLNGYKWHDQIVQSSNDGERQQNIFKEALNKVWSNSQNIESIPEILKDWRDQLESTINTLPKIPSKPLSTLQVIERLDRFIFKTYRKPKANLQYVWRNTQDSNRPAAKKIQDLLNLIDGWGYAGYFFNAMLNDSGKDALYRYVLSEFESAQDGVYLHRDSKFELEHIFPQDPPSDESFDLKRYGFIDRTDYQKFISRFGNRMLIPKSLNQAIGRHWPDVKADAYINQSFANTSVPFDQQRTSIMELGKVLKQVDDTRFYRLALELRGIEIALFALQRF